MIIPLEKKLFSKTLMTLCKLLISLKFDYTINRIINILRIYTNKDLYLDVKRVRIGHWLMGTL